RGGILFVRRAIADMTVDDHERRSALGAVKYFQRILDTVDVVGIANAQHVPPIPEKSGRDVLCERQLRAPLDRDVVVVENPAEIVQAQWTGERSGLRRNSFHHAAIAA